MACIRYQRCTLGEWQGYANSKIGAFPARRPGCLPSLQLPLRGMHRGQCGKRPGNWIPLQCGPVPPRRSLGQSVSHAALTATIVPCRSSTAMWALRRVEDVSLKLLISRNASCALRLCKAVGHTAGEAFEQGDHARRESIPPPVVELQQAEGLAGCPQGDQGHRFITLSMAAVTRASLPIRIGRAGQQLTRGIGPEAANGSEKRLGRVETAASTLPHMHARIGLPSLSCSSCPCASTAQR